MGAAATSRVLLGAAQDATRQALSAALEPDGHDLVHVPTAAALGAALERAWTARAPFRVLVTEADLSDGSAFDAIRRARRAGIRPRTVILTGTDAQEVYYEAYRLQCMCVLRFPPDRGELRRIVALLAHANRGS